MSNDRPETLEETQRRLAGYSTPRPQTPPPAATQPPPPPAGLQPPPPPAGLQPPPPPAGLQPPPPPAGLEPAAQPTGAPSAYGPVPTPSPAGYTQPGYAPGASNPYGAAPTGATPRNRRGLGILLAVAGLVVVVTIGIALVVGQLVSSNNQAGPAYTPAPTTAPADNGDWEDYPGSAYRDDSVVLAQLSAEEVRDTGESIIQEYRDELTSTLGIVWVEEYSGSFERDFNGYGEDSMLYRYDSSSWIGEASAATPEMRQQVMDAFERITAKYNVTDFYRANDVYDPPDSISSFGAEKIEDQALWRFSSRGDATLPVRLSSSVWDRTLPTDPSFTNASGFYLDDGADGKLYIIVSASAFALLSEEDKDAFVEALKPYEGLTKPDPN